MRDPARWPVKQRRGYHIPPDLQMVCVSKAASDHPHPLVQTYIFIHTNASVMRKITVTVPMQVRTPAAIDQCSHFSRLEYCSSNIGAPAALAVACRFCRKGTTGKKTSDERVTHYIDFAGIM